MSWTDVTQKTASKFADADATVGVPTDVPSILELKRILPKHCFQVLSERPIYVLGQIYALV